MAPETGFLENLWVPMKYFCQKTRFLWLVRKSSFSNFTALRFAIASHPCVSLVSCIEYSLRKYLCSALAVVCHNCLQLRQPHYKVESKYQSWNSFISMRG
jgi:hypothetical protein